MKILFIVPTIKQLRIKKNLKPIGSLIFRVPFLGILTVASLIPEKHDITIIDEHIEKINFDFDCDIVGITVATSTAKRSYDIAREFRNRGKKVFVGGFHPSFNPYEALKYVDSVIVGEAENNIQELIGDFEKGNLKKIYKKDGFCDPAEIPEIRRHLIRYPKKYFTINNIAATRGCPFLCNFCGVRQFFNNTYRKRPIENVIGEIKKMKGKKILFTDDNLIGDINYAKKLFKELIPLKKWWMGQVSINFYKDEELMSLAAKSGCLGVFIGLETINKENIKSEFKNQNIKEDYKKVIKKIHSHGISVEAGLMFGFDNDKKDIFKDSVDYFLESGVDCIQVDPITGFPGTPLYDKFKDENRLITNDWNKFNIAETTFKPVYMTSEELDKGVDYVRRRFYTPMNIIKRFFRVLKYRGVVAALIVGYINYGYYKHLKKNIGYPP